MGKIHAAEHGFGGARLKIANCHFTTLVPNSGVVSVGEEQSFVMADIGHYRGRERGAGLGHDFLRHIDRCRLLLHLVDAAGSEGGSAGGYREDQR